MEGRVPSALFDREGATLVDLTHPLRPGMPVWPTHPCFRHDMVESYERGETVDIAKVMLARQQASVGFEATLQVRNKLLSAYKDIMSMPV